ncbi:39S ribosomal protein L40, mitochondrial [Python bivittatus]|uniref:Large ribosomal subunit protein mL40 n=1 Tax=Python bivittatus TaxID=176946 RepID=A0A9F2QAK3_PYTBI|nr:39S ribosomal protein L40, mitochondrial [Python bivittatus]
MWARAALGLFGSGAGGVLFRSQLIWNVQLRASHWQSSLLGLRTALPMRAEPAKKKRVDPKKDQALKERLKKKIRRLEKAAQELIPIEDFIVPFRFMDEKRVRELTPLSPEESERRAQLLKKWSVYKYQQDKAEMDTMKTLVAAQEQALKELRLESEELYQAAIQRDVHLFPFDRQEPLHNPPQAKYEAPEGKCNDLTRIYTY